VAALAYLARANRFSRTPSAVADYLATTRGTASQTLLTLARKGFVADGPAFGDRRSRLYSLTEAGRAVIRGGTAGLAGDDDEVRDGLRRALAALLRTTGSRTFGLCRSCRHHRPWDGGGGFCALLGVPLLAEEADQICVDHTAA
jgi:DNA-binding MarR family transcriptional regulator